MTSGKVHISRMAGSPDLLAPRALVLHLFVSLLFQQAAGTIVVALGLLQTLALLIYPRRFLS